jgi:hypothetical protein
MRHSAFIFMSLRGFLSLYTKYQYHFVKRNFIVVLVLTALICLRYRGKRGIKTSSDFLVSSDASLVQTCEMESRKWWRQQRERIDKIYVYENVPIDVVTERVSRLSLTVGCGNVRGLPEVCPRLEQTQWQLRLHPTLSFS